MTVKAFLESTRHPIVSANRADSVASVIALLAERRIGCVPVVEDDRVLGIFSERDVVYGLAEQGDALLRKPVEAVMTQPALTIPSETPILSALSLMSRRRIRHLPIVDDGKMVGFVSIGDLVKSRIDRIEAEAEAMRSYIQNA